MQYNQRMVKPGAKIEKLYSVQVAPLERGDFIVMMPIEIPLLRFRELTVGLPEFITLIPESVFQYIIRNINGQVASFEYILVNLMAKVKDDFAVFALPEDPVVLRTAEVAIAAFIYDIQGIIHQLGLLDINGMFHYKLSSMNQFEAILYDNRLRATTSQAPPTMGSIQLGSIGGLG